MLFSAYTSYAFVDTQRFFPGATTARAAQSSARDAQSSARAAQSSTTLGTGAMIGIAVGGLLFGMAIMSLVLLGIPRYVTVKHTSIFC